VTVAQTPLRRQLALFATLASAKRGGSTESVIVSWRQSFSVRPELLLPAEFVVSHLLDSVEERIPEREFNRECSHAVTGRALHIATRATTAPTRIRHPHKRVELSSTASLSKHALRGTSHSSSRSVTDGRRPAQLAAACGLRDRTRRVTRLFEA
jgi:hypothetical protein